MCLLRTSAFMSNRTQNVVFECQGKVDGRLEKPYKRLRPSGMPDRLGRSCPALGDMDHGCLGIMKKYLAYMTTRWYACSELLGKCGRPVEECSSTGEVYVGGPGAPASHPWTMVLVSTPRMRTQGQGNKCIPWGEDRACSRLRFGF